MSTTRGDFQNKRLDLRVSPSGSGKIATPTPLGFYFEGHPFRSIYGKFNNLEFNSVLLNCGLCFQLNLNLNIKAFAAVVYVL